MANRFYSPNQQFCDGTGAPYAGGSLAFYASGTSTPLATYSDAALTIANTNPVVLDSAGRAGNIFLQNLAYKVVLSDVNSNVIWTDDPVYTSDYSTRAKLLSGSGSPNGSIAGTAGSASIGADVYWDTTNNILYVCTQTGTSSTAVWTAVNASTSASVVPPPQGYLTLTSGTPIITGDVTGAGTVYYTPYIGSLVPVYSGTSFNPTVFSELSLSISSLAASTIFDVFVFNNAGSLTLVTGPAWTTSTAGSGARGTGAGTTQLSRLNGLWVNTVSMTGKNGANTYSIPASQGTYLGSIFTDTTPGQVTCHRTYGQSRKWGVWNAYNRVPIIVKAGDATAGWTIGGGGSAAFRALNGASANSITIFSGLPEETAEFSTYMRGTYAATTNIFEQFYSGVGVNSTSTPVGIIGTHGVSFGGTVTGNFTFIHVATGEYVLAPGSIGTNVITHLEAFSANTAAPTVVAGGEFSNLILARWRG